MANQLESNLKDDIIQAYLSTGSISGVAKKLHKGRNTIRSLLKAEGLLKQPTPIAITTKVDSATKALPPPEVKPKFEVQFDQLEKLFATGKDQAEYMRYAEDIKAKAIAISEEIGITATADVIRLEMAIIEYIQHRRYFMKSLKAMSEGYIGPFSKSHEKAAKACEYWDRCSARAFENWNRLIKELEIKYGKRFPNQIGNIFVQNNIHNNEFSKSAEAQFKDAKPSESNTQASALENEIIKGR